MIPVALQALCFHLTTLHVTGFALIPLLGFKHTRLTQPISWVYYEVHSEVKIVYFNLFLHFITKHICPLQDTRQNKWHADTPWDSLWGLHIFLPFSLYRIKKHNWSRERKSKKIIFCCILVIFSVHKQLFFHVSLKQSSIGFITTTVWSACEDLPVFCLL